MRRTLVSLSRAMFQAMYRRCDRKRREDLVVFLSRQADRPSYDFARLANEFERRGWTCAMHLKKVRARNIVAYIAHVAREIRLLGRCKVAVLDRYDPVVSLLDFECDPRPQGTGTAVNLDFPNRPVVVQLWHAFGAFKKFGYQYVDTPEGHPADFMADWRIHRNYSWVLCSCEAARPAYAEAFSCPPERVVALARPEYDELATLGRERAARSHTGRGGAPRVLMAPTLRKDSSSAHPFRELHAGREEFERELGMNVTWSFHPLESRGDAPGNVSSQLLEADYVVTDYSSIAYEACVLGIPVVFYVPDLESYRLSPGLNADPGELCPELCKRNPEELAEFLRALAEDPRAYPRAALARFAASGFDGSAPGDAASRIADFAISKAEAGPTSGRHAGPSSEQVASLAGAAPFQQ